MNVDRTHKQQNAGRPLPSLGPGPYPLHGAGAVVVTPAEDLTDPDTSQRSLGRKSVHGSVLGEGGDPVAEASCK